MAINTKNIYPLSNALDKTICFAKNPIKGGIPTNENINDWFDSILFTLNASNIKPKCEIVLYANNLLIRDCVKPNTVPIIKDNKELSNKPDVQLKSVSINTLLV